MYTIQGKYIRDSRKKTIEKFGESNYGCGAHCSAITDQTMCVNDTLCSWDSTQSPPCFEDPTHHPTGSCGGGSGGSGDCSSHTTSSSCTGHGCTWTPNSSGGGTCS